MFHVSLIQMNSTNNIQSNINKAYSYIEKAITKKTDIIALPENFAYMIKEGKKPEIDENLYEKLIKKISELAKKGNVYILAGTIPEKAEGEKFYNTSTVIDREGNIVAKYRKIHLFDVNLEDKELKESKYIQRGKNIVSFKADNIYEMGLSICYDLRFPELYRKLIERKIKAVFIPAAFSSNTGKDHWEVLLRARAIENQIYIFAPAQCGKHSQDRESYGHSMIIDPWGIVIGRKGEGEGILTSEIDFDYIETVRKRIPSLNNRILS